MTQPGWDDERIAAAFQARFDHSAPPALQQDVHVRLAGTSPSRFAPATRSRAWSFAAAAVVVVLIGSFAFVGLGGVGRSGGPLGADASATIPGASATPTEQALPGSVYDGALPIIRVSDAIAVRDAGVDDRELAVKGWLTVARPRNCGIVPPDRPVSPVQLHCPDDGTWLTEDHKGTEAPTGPAMNPMVGGLDLTSFEGSSDPVDVVLVGHFDDRRAELCPRVEIDACRDRFVVDSVAVAGGVVQPVSRLRMTEGVVSSDAAVEAIVGNEAPDSPILSMTVVSGPGGLTDLEPSLGTGQANLIDQLRLWIVRVLESDRVVTYIVVDGSDAIYEMNPKGEAILVGGTPPTSEATASPGSWPPAGAHIVTLTSEVGAGEPPVQIAVVDESGRLEAASEIGEVDPATIPFDGRFGAYAEPGHPGRVHLTWVGGICDSRIVVTVAPDVRSISFDMGPQRDCDSIGIGRQLVLDFSGSVDVGAIQVGEGATAPAPSDALGYELDCGPIGPDTCETKAASIVALTPVQRVVSLVFFDECGSYLVTFEDGDSIRNIVDCIPGTSPN